MKFCNLFNQISSPQRKSSQKVPPYFYVNVPNTNIDLSQILLELDALPIQISYKIKK